MRVTAIQAASAYERTERHRTPTPLPSSAAGVYVLCYEMRNGQGVEIGCPSAREGIMRAGTLMRNPACRYVGVYLRGQEYKAAGAIVHWREIA